MCALEDVKISNLKEGFLMSGKGGATLKGTSLYHQGPLKGTHGIRKRGSAAKWKNQIIKNNRFVHMQSSDGNHLVVLTISKNGKHPKVTMSGHSVNKYQIKVGKLVFQISDKQVTFK